MLQSVEISRRQSEIRQELSTLVAKPDPSEDETRALEALDSEYRANEARFRAALIAEDEEREEAKGELENRSEAEFTELMDGFEMRQVALALDEGRTLDGATAEVVTELRSQGGYRGIPVPWEALETRAGETIAGGVPDPIRTAPIIDRLFASSVAARMGARMINVGIGEVEYPVCTSDVTAAWAANETGAVAAPKAYETVDRPLKPDNTLGVQMKITRKSLKQAGTALEQAVRRDMNGAIASEMDRVVFLGTGRNGQPSGIVTGASGYGITETTTNAANWAAFRSEIAKFMVANAATGPANVKVLIRPEIWDAMDNKLISGTAVSEWDRLVSHVSATNVMMSSNAVAAPNSGASVAVLTTAVNGVAPFFVGTWGAIDLIRDPYADAPSGGLRLTALATMDVTVSRPVQTAVIKGLK